MKHARVHAEPEWFEVATPDGARVRVRKKPHPRSRHLRLTVTPEGARVSCPRATGNAELVHFLEEHATWLQHKLAQMRALAPELPPLVVGEPAHMPLRGKTVRLCWSRGDRPHVTRTVDGVRLVVPCVGDGLSIARGLLATFLEDHMREDIARGLARHVPQLQLAPGGVRVRALKSLWGSLDTRDRISLDLALALAPPETLEYVLVHELCHLKVRNHSRAFWQHVARLYPDHHHQREWLRHHGAALKAQLDRLIRGSDAHR